MLGPRENTGPVQGEKETNPVLSTRREKKRQLGSLSGKAAQSRASLVSRVVTAYRSQVAPVPCKYLRYRQGPLSGLVHHRGEGGTRPPPAKVMTVLAAEPSIVSIWPEARDCGAHPPRTLSCLHSVPRYWQEITGRYCAVAKLPERLTRPREDRPCTAPGFHAAVLSYLHGCCGGYEVHVNCPSRYFLMRS